MFVSWSNAKGSGNNWSELNLKANVKSVIEKRFEATEKPNNNQNRNLTESCTTVFNVKGNISEEIISLPDGNLKRRTEFMYDVNGKMPQKNVFEVNNKLIEKITFIYGKMEKKLNRMCI